MIVTGKQQKKLNQDQDQDQDQDVDMEMDQDMEMDMEMDMDMDMDMEMDQDQDQDQDQDVGQDQDMDMEMAQDMDMNMKMEMDTDDLQINGEAWRVLLQFIIIFIMDKITINGEEYILASSIKNSERAVNTEGMKHVIVRTYSAGVFAGYLESRNGQEVVLRNERRRS